MVLASTLDGTQTLGMDATALFPSTPPTNITPPYSSQDFPLYLKPTSEAYADVVAAVVRSLRQPSTPLNVAFFSKANVDALQEALRARIAETMGLTLDRQSDWEMLLIMRQVYMDGASNWPDSVEEEVSRLDGQVLQVASRAVSGNVMRYMSYRSHVDMPAPMLRPAEMVTSPAYETGTPAPLPNFNFGFDRQREQEMSNMPVSSKDATPALFPTMPPREMATTRP